MRGSFYGDIGDLIAAGTACKKPAFIFTCIRCGKSDAFPMDSMVCDDKENPRFIDRWHAPAGKYVVKAGNMLCAECAREYDAMIRGFMGGGGK